MDEVKALVDHGLSVERTLAAATSEGAVNVGLVAEIGSVKSGKRADLIAVSWDPLDDLSALDEVTVVMRDGRVLVSRVASIPVEEE